MNSKTQENRNEDSIFLEQRLYNGEITLLECIQKSEEHRDLFERYCTERGLTPDDKVAGLFLDWVLEEEEKAHTDMLD